MTETGFDSQLGAAYQLLEVVGRGASGEVWRAVDRRTQETVAAKLLRAEHVADRDLVARFIQERSVLTDLRHPNLVSVRDLVVEGDRLAIVMDYVAGGTLRDVVREQGPLRPAVAVALVAQVLDGLAAAHDRRLVHRDIKPDNVLLSPEWQQLGAGSVLLTDFGIARIVGEGPKNTTGLLGTPEYMSPELLTTGAAGTPSDVYGVGILLYEVLGGRTPFAGPGTDYTVAHRHVSSVPPVLPVPDELWAVTATLLDKDPRGRPTALAAADALRRLAAGLEDVPALVAQPAPGEFSSARGPVTVVRGLTPDPTADDLAEDGPDDGVEAGAPPVLPDLGPPGSVTTVRPMSRPASTAPARLRDSETEETQPAPWWRDRRVQAGVAGSVALVAVVAFVLVKGVGRGGDEAPAAAQSATVVQQDNALPTGLTISRAATYDARDRTVDLTVTYGAQNSTLRGPFLEVIGGLKGASCASVTWKGRVQGRNLPTITGMDAGCSWSVDPGEVPRQDKVSVTARVQLPGAMKDPQPVLQSWLDRNATSTLDAVSDPEITSTSYAAQRLQGIDVVAPSQTVSGKTLPLTLLPVWPKGPDQLNPLYRSPSVARPSGLLAAVAGGEAGVRFTDGCSGALAVSSDGLVVTALRVAAECRVDARVGNFTDLESNDFSISTRGG